MVCCRYGESLFVIKKSIHCLCIVVQYTCDITSSFHILSKEMQAAVLTYGLDAL